MNIVDSSGWLAYFADEPSSQYFHIPLSDKDSLIVPVITIYEVAKVVLREAGENEALQIVSAMQQGTIIELTTKLALDASRFSLQYKLPMADSIIFATAKYYDAIIWTQDIDFKSIPGVRYFDKTKTI